MLAFSILVLLVTLSVVWLKLLLVSGLALLGLWIVTRPEPGSTAVRLIRR
ncbi:hypothetical protein [Billgrantia tianxiuensis]